MTVEAQSPPKELRSPYSPVEHWKPFDVSEIVRLEEVWASWLRKPPEHIATIAERFSETQLLIRNPQKKPVATLTATRMNWDGDPDSLTTWDDAVGGGITNGDLTRSYDSNGNTICIISSAIDPAHRHKGLSKNLMTGIKRVAQELQVTHLIGPFRPNQYGQYRKDHGYISFADYCNLTRGDGEPYDAWLRVAQRAGMQPLRIEENSMVIHASNEEFEGYKKTDHPSMWRQTESGIECGETGLWVPDSDGKGYTYRESNQWRGMSFSYA